MKQRLLLVLLALFTSIGWMNATVKLTVPAGATGSLSFTVAKGGKVSIGGVAQETTSYTITKNETTDQQIEIIGELATLTINTKVTSVEISDAEELTSLVFNTASEIKTFALDGSCKLKTLTANNCGLTNFPTDLENSLATPSKDVTVSVSLKNNKLTDASSFLTPILNQEISIDLSGNNITTWPSFSKEDKVKITFGDQGEFKGLKAQKANEWYDVLAQLDTKIKATDWTYTWKQKASSGTLTSITLEANSAYKGQYIFYDTNKKAYVSGDFQVEAKSASKGITYKMNVEVEKAQTALTIENSDGGSLNITKATSGGGTVSNGTPLTEGQRLYLSPKADNGWAFKEYELVGLEKSSEDNIYIVKIKRDGQYDKLSAKAIFTQKTYKITLDASSENGHYVITDAANQEIKDGTSVAYNSTLTIMATPEKGYKARVIVNKSELKGNETATGSGVYKFTTSITTASTIQILFDKTAEYDLMVKTIAGYDLKVNGNSYPKPNNGQYYVSDKEDNTSYPEFAAGTLITLEMEKTDAATLNIKKVLLNSQEIGTGSSTGAKVQFEMPSNAATITFEMATLADIAINVEGDSNIQTYEYDGSAHPFVFTTTPANLTGFTVTYSVTGVGNYGSSVPTAVGKYDVKIYRAADALYKAVNKTATYQVEITKATPIVKTLPTVSVDKTSKEYTVSGGSVQVAGKAIEGTWKVTKTAEDNVSIKDNKCVKDASHLVEIEFTPSNTSYYYTVTTNTQAVVDGKNMSQYTITYDLPTGMTLKMTNGNQELASGDKVYPGTKVKFELTYPKGYSDVELVEDKNSGSEISTNKEEGEQKVTYKDVEVNNNLLLKVTYSGGVSTTDVKLDLTDQEKTYDGQVSELVTPEDFTFTTPNGSATSGDDHLDVTALKAKMVITYKLNGKEVASPVNAGEYTVHVSIPKVVGEKTTYNALEKDFEKGYVIKKIQYKVDDIDWPTDAVVGIGQDAKSAQFIGGFAPIEGTFHFVEEDKIGVPTTGSSYAVKFVPADATNYAEVLSTKTATVVVTDKRTLFIADMTNGSVTVLDQNGKALKDGQILDSSITSIKVTAIPNNGYVLGTLKVNNSTISSGSTYTLGSDNVTISATFIKQHTITLGAAPKGVKIASKPSSNIVNDGGSYTFTLNHVSGDKPTVTGTSNISVSTSGSTTTVKVTNIKANATLTIALAKPTAIKITTKETLSKAGKPMGTIRVTGVNSSNECYYGDKITVSATANPGVEFAGWEGLTSTENPYEFEATNATYTFQAKYDGVLTGIESIDELKYYGGDGYIFVNCPAQGTLTIISMNGRAQKMSVSGQTRVTVPAGVYGIVLTSGSEVVRDKVVVR